MRQQKQYYQQPSISVVRFNVEVGVTRSGDVSSASPNFEIVHENKTLTEDGYGSNDYGGFFE